GEREFARDNKSLGIFHLDGIAPARRGVPQIEVTFDIDANGIVNVSAKDLGTGREQHITITSSSNMSKEDVEKAVREAEQYAAEDKKKRENVDTKNGAEQAAYQCEQALSELGDKISEDEKSQIQTKIDALKETLKGEDYEAMKTAQDDLMKVFYDISAKVYQANAPQGDPAAAEPQNPQSADGYYDGDVQ
ncbi:MAG: Hsp70 family protein, partial [Clostridia bacterium]|nr:Hsp70 family protein [Clostridia bacterium]